MASSSTSASVLEIVRATPYGVATDIVSNDTRREAIFTIAQVRAPAGAALLRHRLARMLQPLIIVSGAAAALYAAL